MKQSMRGLRTAFAVFGCVLAFSGVRADESFTFDDIHFWVGEGSNRAGFVFDWNNGQPGSSIAYGIRWDGPSTNVAHLLQVLADEDRRLHAALVSESWGTWVLGFAYDADGDGGAFDMGGGRATDSDDFIAVGQSEGLWAVTRTNAVAISGGFGWTTCTSQLDVLFPVNGDWFGLRRVSGEEEEKTPAKPNRAESPYAVELVAYFTDLEEVLKYGPTYANMFPETVLGRPSSYSPGWEYQGYVFPDVNITPHSQAFGTNQVFSMASLFDDEETLVDPGSVTVKFDHKVLDDPQNPFGLDLIVFGNAFLYVGEFQYFDGMGDPNNFSDEMSVFDEKPGRVEVSQDGITWFAYDTGPFANTFPPTISHLYDTNSPDASVFAGNQWWGKQADPTLPVDPTLVPSDFAGRSIAEYATLFNGSSGGTGFDIGGFVDLPVDATTGRKWIQYVRVTTVSSYDDAMWAVVDAFADVSPALPYDNWVRENYAWAEVPDETVTGKGVMAVNGKPNYYNAAFGTAPDAVPVERFGVSSFVVENGKAIFTVPSGQFAYDVFRVGKASDVNGKYQDSLPSHEGTVVSENGVESVFSIPVDAVETKAFYKIGLSAE